MILNSIKKLSVSKTGSFFVISHAIHIRLIPIHQIHSLCGCNKHKRVQRYAMTRRKAVSEKIPTENIGQLPIPPRPTKRTMILPSSHSPSGNQSAAGNGGGSVRPTVGVQFPWRQFAADRLVTSLALSRISIFGVSGTNRKCLLS